MEPAQPSRPPPPIWSERTRHPTCGCGTIGPGCSQCRSSVIDVRLNTTLQGRYRIDGLIGHGGMGKVYRARHLALGVEVAVKVLVGDLPAPDEMRARFRREAALLARLRHPGVVSVLDFGEDHGDLFIVMELLRGNTLDKLYSPEAPLPVERAVELMDQVLAVLSDVHALGVVHRDLKPENVMIESPGEQVKVLDFGIASVSDRAFGPKLTAMGAVRGTACFMSPEQCIGRPVTSASDVYAVGAVLYELIAGRAPFIGESATEVLAQQMYSAVPSFADVGAPQKVPFGVEAMIVRAMAKRAEDRPTVPQFRAGLRRALNRSTSVPDTSAQSHAVAMGRSRDARALSEPKPPETCVPLARQLNGRLTSVVLWGFSQYRAETLCDALRPLGVDALPHSGAALPPSLLGGSAWKALVIAAGQEADGRLRLLRESATLRTTPALVIDLESAGQSAAYIRAGASDVALDRVDDEIVCQKILRALRRGR